MADEIGGMSSYTPVDFGTWSASPEGARIEDPLQKIRAYDDRLRKDLYREGLYTEEAEKQIVQAGADQAVRAGHIADPAEYAPPIAATAPDEGFLASALIGEGNTEKASAIYRAQSFRGRADTAPETLARAEQEAALDPAEVNRLTKAAVRTGKLPFAVVQNDQGEQILEVDPELGALSREEILDLADTVPGGVDPRVLPMLEKQFTRAPGSNYTPAQARQESVFAKFIAEKGKTDDFLAGQVEDAITEYNRNGVLSDETRGSLDRTLAALDVDNEFSPASRTRYLNDMVRRAAKPEAYDPENPQNHVQFLEDGSVWLPDQVVFNEAEYKGTLDKLTGITPEQKEASIAQREARLATLAPQYVDAMGANPEALDFYTQAKAAGKTDSEIATEWFGDKTKYSAVSNRLRSAGMGFADATKGFVESIQAMAFDDKGAMDSLVARRENMARNEEYARLSGDSYGIGQSVLNTAPQVVADLLIAGGISAVATPVAGASLIGARTAATSAVRSLARSAVTAGTKSTLKTLVRGGAVKTAEAIASLGNDVVSNMARTAGTQSALATSTFARAAGSSYVSTYSALDAQTLPNGTPRYTDEEKRKIALGAATVSGISTAAITLGFGAALGPGFEGLVSGKIGTRALRNVFKMSDDQIAAASRSSALAILKSAGAEAPEEAVDQLLSGVYEKIATGEEFRLGPALKEALEAGAVGGLLGAGAGTIQALATKPRDPAVAKLEAAGAPRAAAAVEAQSNATAPVDPVADLRDAATEVGARVAELSAQLTELKTDPEGNKGRIARVNKRLAEAKAEKTRIDFAIKNPDTIRMSAGADQQRTDFEPAGAQPAETQPAAATQENPDTIRPDPATPDRRARALARVLVNRGVSDAVATRFASAMSRTLPEGTTLEEARDQVTEAFKNAGGRFADEQEATAPVRTNPDTWIAAGYTPEEAAAFAATASQEAEAAVAEADAVNETIEFPAPPVAEAAPAEEIQVDDRDAVAEVDDLEDVFGDDGAAAAAFERAAQGGPPQPLEEAAADPRRVIVEEPPTVTKVKAIHFSREPLKLTRSKDISSIDGRYEEESSFGPGFYAMEPKDEKMWTDMGRFTLGPNRNEVEINPERPLVIDPATIRSLDIDKVSEDVRAGVYDAVFIRGFGDEDVSSEIMARVEELWSPKFEDGKTEGRFINGDEYDAAVNRASQEILGVSREVYEKLSRGGWLQNQIFIPADAAPDVVSINQESAPEAATPAAQERTSSEIDKLAAAGHVPTHNDFMARFKVNAAKASAMRKELTAAIRALYPLVAPPASATMKTAKVLGLNDLKEGKNAVQVPIFDERTAPFTNDPHITALQLSAGRSVAVPTGVSLNPSIFLSPDGRHVSASTANTGQVVYGSGQYNRPSYVRAAYVPTKNKPKYMASVSTLPTATFSTLPSRVVTYAKNEIDPSKATEADLIAYFFGSDEKVKRMARSKSPGLSDTELESITNSVQFAFLREIREFFLSPSDVPATIDPKGFGKTTESYKKYLAERARHFLGANPENYWSDKGAPASPFYFIEGEIKNAAQGARSRPKEAVGDDQVTTDDIIDRAAARASEEDAADVIELFQEDWLEGAVEGTGILIGAEGVPTPDAAADIAARFIRAMGSNPQLRTAFNALIVNASPYALGNPKRISYAATIRAMDDTDAFMVGASAVFVRPELMQSVDFRAMMAPAVSAFTDTEVAANRESNAAAAADLQLDGDLRSALERVARSAKFPRRYRAIAKAALQMRTLPSLHMVDSPTAAYAGFYSGSANSIHLNMASSNGRGLLDVLAHELLHAATAEIVRNPRTAKERALRDRLERYRIAVVGNVPSDMSYAVSSLDEFITHCATDPRFQRIARETVDAGRSVWDKIVEAIASFFGITNRGFVSDLWGFINHGAEYTNRAETLRTPVVLESLAAAPEVAPSRRALPDPAEVESRTVAGKPVGTRSPKAKGVKGTGVNQELRIDLASARLDPKLYKKNAFLLSSYAVVAKEFPEIAARSATATRALEDHDALIEGKRADVARLGAALTKSIKESRASRGKPLKGKAGQGAAMTALMEKEPGALASEWRAAKKKLKKLVADRPEVAKKATAKIDAVAAKLTMEEADALYEGLKTATRDNLKALIDLFPVRLRDVAKLWYDGANIVAQGFSESYKLSLEQTSAVIAVFSPQKDWFMNVAIAKRTMDIWTNHQNTPFSDAMAKNFIDRAGQPQFVYDKKGEQQFNDPETKLDPKYTGGAVPIFNETGNEVVGWRNWDAEKAAKSVEDARLELAAMRGKTLAQLEGRHQAVFIRMHEEVNNPGRGFPIISPDGNFGGNKQTEPDKNGQTRDQKLGWGSYVTIDKAIAIMTAPKASEMQIISDALGEQHKVRSFYNNIVDPQSRDGHVTMDTHAIAALLWQALSGASRAVIQNFGGAGTASSGILGVNGLYPAFAEAYRALAADLEVLPRQVQSITWEAIRILFPAKWKSQKSNVAKVDRIWQDYRDGTITADDARTRIFELTNPGATGGPRSLAEPDWAQIFFSGTDPAGSQEADDQGVLPADRESVMGSGRGALGSGMDRDAAGLPDGPAGRGGVDTRFAQSPTAGTATTDTLDRYLPQPPAGMSYEFEGTRGKYLAYVSRSAPNTITINRAGLNALIEGLDPANARAIVRKIVNHEIAHHAAFSAFTPAEIAEMASRLSPSDLVDIASKYYGVPPAAAFERMEADMESGTLSEEALVDEYLRMHLERVTDGATTEDTIAFHSNNPGFVARFVRYLKDALAKMWAIVGGPNEDYATRVEISRLMRELRAIQNGHRAPQPVPLPKDDLGRDNVRFAAAPTRESRPEDAIFDKLQPSTLGTENPYSPASLMSKLFRNKMGDRRLHQYLEQRGQNITAIEDLAKTRGEALKKAIASEKPPQDVVDQALGERGPTTTAAQDKAIKDVYDAAIKAARSATASPETKKALAASRDAAIADAGTDEEAVKMAKKTYERLLVMADAEAQKSAVQEAARMKDAMRRAAIIETAREAKERISYAQSELDKNFPKTGEAIRKGREFIDRMSEGVSSILPDGGHIKFVVDTRNGVYLTMAYNLHHSDGNPLDIMSDPDKADIVAAAKEQLMRTLIEGRAEELIDEQAEAGLILGEAEAREAARTELVDQGIDQTIVEDYLLEHGSKAVYHSGSKFSADWTRFMKQNEVPEALRALLGEITDPVQNLMRSAMNVGTLAASMRLAEDFAAGGHEIGALVTRQQKDVFRKMIQTKDEQEFLSVALEVGFGRVAPKKGYLPWEKELDGAPVYLPVWLIKARQDRDVQYLDNFRPVAGKEGKYGVGRLSEFLAHPDVAGTIEEIFATRGGATTDSTKLVEKMGNALAGMTGVSLGVATLGSIGFFSRQIFAVPVALASNGINPVSKDVYRAVGLAMDIVTGKESYWKTRLNALGMSLDDLRPSVLKELVKTEIDRPGGFNILEMAGKLIDKAAMGATDGKGVLTGTKLTEYFSKLGEVVSAIDSVAKLAAFFTELRVIEAAYPDKSKEWHETEAAETVKRTMQARSQSMPIFDALGKSSYGRLMSPFLRFKGEVFRLVHGIPEQAMKEIRSGIPVLVKRGRARMAGFSTAMAFSIAGPAVLSALFGVGDDEEYALRQSLPPYLRGSSLIYRKSEDGRTVTSINTTYLNYLAMIGDPISRVSRAVLRGDASEAADEAAIWFTSQFLEDQIFAGAAFEVLRNETSDGRKITFETDSFAEAVVKKTQHMFGSAFTPQILKVADRAIRTANNGVPADAAFLETPAGIILGHAAPVKPVSIDLNEAAVKAGRTFFATNRDIRTVPSQLKRRRGMGEDEIKDVVDEWHGSFSALNTDMARAARGFESMGLAKPKVSAALTEAGFSKERSRELVFAGLVRAPAISPTLRQDIIAAGDAAQGKGAGVKRLQEAQKALRAKAPVISVSD